MPRFFQLVNEPDSHTDKENQNDGVYQPNSINIQEQNGLQEESESLQQTIEEEYVENPKNFIAERVFVD